MSSLFILYGILFIVAVGIGLIDRSEKNARRTKD
jgi:hypothetical protein